MKINKNIPFFFIAGSLVVMAVSISACRNKPDLSNSPQISFSSAILPIIGGTCQAPSCHSTSSNALQIVTYDNFLKNGRIVPGNPYKSNIYKTITSQLKGTVMPVPPRKPLTEVQIQTIFIWIEQGAKNN